jgi:hypothetical protein
MISVLGYPALEQARQRIFDAFGADITFTGCGIGLRRRGGVLTDEPVVVAMVTKKLPAGAVSRSRLLPRAVEADGKSWGVDVVEVGPLTLAGHHSEAAGRRDGVALGGPITQKMRPPLQGCSVSDATGPSDVAGTFGCLVRDSSDGTICVFGSNFVLADSGRAPSGETVIQPAQVDGGTPQDGIASLKRYVPFTSGSNYVDAAIAQLTQQTGYSQNVADNLMKPISASHPAVGTCVAGDSEGLNCFLSPMSTTVSALGVELLPATSTSPCIVAPQVGMKIEKVARTSGYTSSTVDAVGAQINVLNPVLNQTFVFANMIWSQAFFLPGDSGAVACQGGNGRTFVPPPVIICGALDSVGHYFDLPLAKDNALTTQLKTQFLAQSLVGNLIIGLVYINMQTIIGRVKGKQAPSVEQAYAHEYYEKYYHLVKAALAQPGSTTRVVTEDNLDDFQFILAGLSGADGLPPLLTSDESQAMQDIYDDVVAATKGMDYQALLSYLNKVGVYEKVVGALRAVPTIKLTGTIAEDTVK